jgi:delta1-piperideine-2-carboxylate reductase
MTTVSLTLDEIFDLAKKTLLANGCDDKTASILSDLIRNAERDGSASHGLFRLPAYISGLKSGISNLICCYNITVCNNITFICQAIK